MTQDEQERPRSDSDEQAEQAQGETAEPMEEQPQTGADEPAGPGGYAYSEPPPIPPPMQAPPGPGEAYYGPVSMPDERNLSMLVHLSALLAIIPFLPLAHIIAPLIVWLIYRAKSDMVDYHGKRALNFQISMTIYFLVSVVLMFVLIGFFTALILGVLWLIWTILAAVRASRGEPPGYILAITFVK